MDIQTSFREVWDCVTETLLVVPQLVPLCTPVDTIESHDDENCARILTLSHGKLAIAKSPLHSSDFDCCVCVYVCVCVCRILGPPSGSTCTYLWLMDMRASVGIILCVFM